MTAFRWEAELNQGHILETVTTAFGQELIFEDFDPFRRYYLFYPFATLLIHFLASNGQPQLMSYA